MVASIEFLVFAAFHLFALETLGWSKSKSTAPNEIAAFEYQPENTLLGMCALCALILASAILFGTSLPGLVAGSVGLWASVIIRFRKKSIGLPPFTFAMGVRALAVAVVATIYGPLLLGQSHVYELPDIFDLPKNLSTMIALNASDTFPVNPYHPDFEFAYNLAFYVPWVAFAKGFGASLSTLHTAFALSAVWMTWQLTGLLERVAALMGLDQAMQRVTVVASVFFVGFEEFHSDNHPPRVIGAGLITGGGAWMEEPLTSFTYVPQHLFSLAALFALLALTTKRLKEKTPSQALLLGLVLPCLGIAAASESSYILLPLTGISLVVTTWVQGKRGAPPWLPLTFLVCSSVIFVLVFFKASRFGGDEQFLVFGPFHLFRVWKEVGIASGFFVPFALVGVFLFLRRRTDIGLSLLALLAGAFFILEFIHYSDSELKMLAALRFGACPFFALGFEAFRRRFSASPVRVFPWLIAFCSITPSVLLPIYFIGSAYRMRSDEEMQMLQALEKASERGTVFLFDSNQRLAAMIPRPVLMNYRAYRNDHYIAAEQRPRAFAVFEEAVLPDGTRPPTVGGRPVAAVLIKTATPAPRWVNEGYTDILPLGAYTLYRLSK